MAVVQWINDLLKTSGVSFEERRHADAATASQVAEKEKMNAAEVAKVVVVLIQDKAVGLVLPANRKVNLSAIEEVAGTRRVRLASEAETQSLFPDCEVGAIPPLNHWKGIEFWMDSSMEPESGEILIQAGTHQDAIRLRYEDWFRLVRPRVEHFAAHKHSAFCDEEQERAKGESLGEVG